MTAPARIIRWSYKGRPYVSTILDYACPQCGVRAIVALDQGIVDEQPDGTTHVCHPSAGGCNLGFELGGPGLPAPIDAPHAPPPSTPRRSRRIRGRSNA